MSVNERSVIGACMLDNECVDLVMSIIKPMHFFDPLCRRVFAIICELSEANEPIDSVSIYTKDKTLTQVVSGCIDFVPTAANVSHYAKNVFSHYQLFELGNIAQDIITSEEKNPAKLIEEVDTRLLAVAGLGESKTGHIKEAIKSATSMQDKKGLLGMRTYWPKLDRQLSGLCPGSLYVVAGRPGMGKTAWATCLMINIARNYPVAYFTLEMSKEEMSTRLICARGGINITKARNRELDNTDNMRWLEASMALSELPIYVDDSGTLSISALRSKARSLKRQHGIELIVVDYLQLMSGNGDSRQQEIGSISRGLKQLAKDLSIPVIALSQLNRKVEERTDKRPVMSDLRESGDIEQDCDVVMMLYRESVYKESAEENNAELIIRKNRNGSLGFLNYDWRGEYCRYNERKDEY